MKKKPTYRKMTFKSFCKYCNYKFEYMDNMWCSNFKRSERLATEGNCPLWNRFREVK